VLQTSKQPLRKRPLMRLPKKLPKTLKKAKSLNQIGLPVTGDVVLLLVQSAEGPTSGLVEIIAHL